MLFNSWTFVVFLLTTLALYYAVPTGRWRAGWQIGLLTLASYTFYGWYTPWLVVILAASTAINSTVTLQLLNRRTSAAAKRRWLFLAIIVNLGVLAFFKYASLLVTTFFPGSWWSHWGFNLAEIPLPIGISFFTFQGISLVVDVYRSAPEGLPGLRPPQTAAESRRLFLHTAFFKAFFPQLVAGPIVKAHEFMHQIGAKHLRQVDWDDATKKLIMGYFLKMVVADNLREATASLSYPLFVDQPGINLLFLLYGFSFQIFADFCGYSLIAMGLARLFGYQLPINFNFPYLSRSITEFWRRWHISLSSWLRQYLYYPLGGNRHGAARTYVNLMIVMLLGGLWHGAAWSFMVWGGAHGLLLVIERLFGVKGDIDHGSTNWGQKALSAVRIFITFNLVSVLWLLFQLPKFDEALLYFHELLAWKPGLLPQSIFTITFFSAPVVLYHLWAAMRGCGWQAWAGQHPQKAGFLLNCGYAVLLFLIICNSGNPGAFIYFQF